MNDWTKIKEISYGRYAIYHYSRLLLFNSLYSIVPSWQILKFVRCAINHVSPSMWVSHLAKMLFTCDDRLSGFIKHTEAVGLNKKFYIDIKPRFLCTSLCDLLIKLNSLSSICAKKISLRQILCQVPDSCLSSHSTHIGRAAFVCVRNIYMFFLFFTRSLSTE